MKYLILIVTAAALLLFAACDLSKSDGDTIVGPTPPPFLLTLIAQSPGDGLVQFSWQVSGGVAPFEVELRTGDGTVYTHFGATGTQSHEYPSCGPWTPVATATEVSTGRQTSDTTTADPC